MTSRRLVLCLDGTWNSMEPPAGVDLTNVARLALALRERDAAGVQQVLFYRPGIGTAGFLDRSVYGFTGRGVDDKIREAYTFLAETWRPGDSIYLFGVSRGAFVALAVSRLLGRYGLPAQPDANAWNVAWPTWLRSEDRGDDGWRKPVVDFLGAWDTVEALGLPVARVRDWTAPVVGERGPTLGATVARACHALAFHEERIAYRPTIWKGPFPPGAAVEQRWFRGTHADVCGGFGDRALADVTLVWMLNRARDAGLAFDDERLARELHPDPFAPVEHLRIRWHRFLPVEPRRPGQTSPESETMDEDLLEELDRRSATP